MKINRLEQIDYFFRQTLHRVDSRAAGNRRLAQWRVPWLIEHSTSHQLLWYIDSIVLRNPPLRQTPKRCQQLVEKLTCNFCLHISIFAKQ